MERYGPSFVYATAVRGVVYAADKAGSIYRFENGNMDQVVRRPSVVKAGEFIVTKICWFNNRLFVKYGGGKVAAINDKGEGTWEILSIFGTIRDFWAFGHNYLFFLREKIIECWADQGCDHGAPVKVFKTEEWVDDDDDADEKKYWDDYFASITHLEFTMLPDNKSILIYCVGNELIIWKMSIVISEFNIGRFSYKKVVTEIKAPIKSLVVADDKVYVAFAHCIEIFDLNGNSKSYVRFFANESQRFISLIDVKDDRMVIVTVEPLNDLWCTEIHFIDLTLGIALNKFPNYKSIPNGQVKSIMVYEDGYVGKNVLQEQETTFIGYVESIRTPPAPLAELPFVKTLESLWIVDTDKFKKVVESSNAFELSLANGKLALSCVKTDGARQLRFVPGAPFKMHDEFSFLRIKDGEIFKLDPKKQ